MAARQKHKIKIAPPYAIRYNLAMSSALEHLHHLATQIGPRGSTTPQEKEAARYAKTQFEQAGLTTVWQTFTAPKSGYRPYAIAAVLGIVSVAIALVDRPLASGMAALLMLVVTGSVIGELYFQPNPLRLAVPKAESQNVWGKIDATAGAKKTVVLMGHIDTHRTPWVFTTPRRLAFFRLVSTLGTAAYILSIFVFLLMAWVDFGELRWLVLLFVPVHVVVFAVSVQPDTTPFTQGANDNGSGAAIVLSLAERLAREPLQNLNVWAVCSGSEEVGSYGAQAFVAGHRDLLDQFVAISIDNVGGASAGVCYTSKEGILFPLHPDPGLFGLAEQLRIQHPGLDIYTQPYTFLHTDGTCFMIKGVPTLSFVGLTPDGRLPHWHQLSDTIENVDPETVRQTEAFVHELLRRYDQAVGADIA